MKHKKLYIIILTFIFMSLLVSFYFMSKTEAPKYLEGSSLKDSTEIKDTLRPAEEIAPPTETEKYKIVSRSIVSPESTLNKKKVVLLTIDDGPGSRTKEMISILEKHNAKAIFFINGMHNKANPGVIKYINDEGFSVGNHTWDHANLKKKNDEKITIAEINKNTELILSETGALPKFFRAPYGESNSQIRNFVKDQGMIFMDWSGAAMDWEKSTIDKDIFVKNVMRNIHSGSIILIHEHPWSVANLDSLLNSIESEGYTYVDPKDIID